MIRKWMERRMERFRAWLLEPAFVRQSEVEERLSANLRELEEAVSQVSMEIKSHKSEAFLEFQVLGTGISRLKDDYIPVRDSLAGIRAALADLNQDRAASLAVNKLIREKHFLKGTEEEAINEVMRWSAYYMDAQGIERPENGRLRSLAEIKLRDAKPV